MLLLKLYIFGKTPKSIDVIDKMRATLEDELSGQFQLDVIDVFQNPQKAEDDRIIATPTLYKYSPEPAIKFIGDVSDLRKVLVNLGLE